MYLHRSNNSKARRGVSLIEVLVAVGIASSFLVATVAGLVTLIEVGNEDTEYIKGVYLLEEAGEIARFIRDDSWSTFASYTSGTTYYAENESDGWSLTTTPVYTDGMVRTIVFSDVERDIGDDIVASGGVVDPMTRRITSSVTWSADGVSSTTISAVTYLGNIFEL